MITSRTQIPESSQLSKSKTVFNYTDCFEGVISTNHNPDITEITKLFLSSGPKWADNLMAIRDKVAGLFGLKTSDQLTNQQQILDNTKFEPGEQLGIFKLQSISTNEVILGEEDKHLNFKVSILIEHTNAFNKKKISISTAVKFNNLFGRIYFLPVKPIHRLIVKATIKDMIRKLNIL